MILRQINNKIEQQIDLDRLTGSIVLQLRAALITIEKSEKRLLIAKTAMLSGCVFPTLCPSLTRAYELQRSIEQKIQQTARMHWNLQEARWSKFKPWLSRKSFFPTMDETRSNHTLELFIRYKGLVSKAELWTTHQGPNHHEWKVAWTE